VHRRHYSDGLSGAHLVRRVGVRQPDLIAHDEVGSWNDPVAVLRAADLATERRRCCVDEGRSLAVETVLSAPDQPTFVRDARARGYSCRLFFVGGRAHPGSTRRGPPDASCRVATTCQSSRSSCGMPAPSRSAPPSSIRSNGLTCTTTQRMTPGRVWCSGPPAASVCAPMASCRRLWHPSPQGRATHRFAGRSSPCLSHGGGHPHVQRSTAAAHGSDERTSPAHNCGDSHRTAPRTRPRGRHDDRHRHAGTTYARFAAIAACSDAVILSQWHRRAWSAVNTAEVFAA